MEKFLTSVSLGFLLRSVFAGVFFMLSNDFAVKGKFDLLSLGAQPTQTTLIALFAGVTMYGLHRSLIYPVIEWFMVYKCVQVLRDWIPLISDEAAKVISNLWRREAGVGTHVECDSDLRKVQAKHIALWADYAHFQYVSAWALLAGAFVHSTTANEPIRFRGPFAVLFVVFFVAGFVSDWRLRKLCKTVCTD